MKKYIVNFEESTRHWCEVEAKDENEAIEKAEQMAHDGLLETDDSNSDIELVEVFESEEL